MKILNIMPYPPVPRNFGGALREYYILENLTHYHDVTAVTYGTDTQYELFVDAFGDTLDGIHMVPPPWERKYRRLAQLYSLLSSRSYFYHHNCSSKMQKLVDKLLSENDFDAVHYEFSVMGGLNIDADVLKIMDTHNVEYENFRRMWKKSTSKLRRPFYRHEYKKVYKEETETFREQDALLVTSEEDKKIMDRDVPEIPKYVIPNGVETSFFKPQEDPDVEPWSIVFTGMMAYTPNDDGMQYFLNEIFPRIQKEIPEAKIYIVGNRPTGELRRREDKNVIVTGFVDDVRPFVWNASVYVVPLRMGSGTRLKVLEALSMKKPVVSTSLGSEGIEVEHGESILIADEPQQFADAVIELLRNKEKGRYLATNGHKMVKSTYEWSVIGNRLQEVYQSFYEKKPLSSNHRQSKEESYLEV